MQAALRRAFFHLNHSREIAAFYFARAAKNMACIAD